MARSRFVSVFAILAAALLLPAVFAQVNIGSASPSFDLKDQFDREWKLSDLNGKVVVIVAATRDSGRAMGPWVDSLKTQYGNNIQLLGLLDLSSVPSIGRGIAKSRIKKETKDPLMLDFNGATAKSYEVSDKYPVVVVIDKRGIVRSEQKTEYNTGAFKATTSAIDLALKSS
jgi:peroxiredoxin